MSEEMHNFIGYEPTVKDPGPMLTVWTIVVCILVNCSLPILVHLAGRLDRHKKRKEEAKETNRDGENTHEDAGSVPGKASSSSVSSSPALGMSLTPQSLFQPAPIGRFHGSVSASSLSIGSDGVQSVCSMQSNVSSTFMSMVASSVLSGGRPHVRKNRCRTAYGSHMRIHFAHNPANGTQDPMSDGDDIHSLDNKSIVSILGHDAVSAGDAIDAAVFPLGMEGEDTNISIWNQFLDIVDWDDESKRLTALTIPYTIQGCTRGLFQMVNIAVIGNHVGVMEANAFVVVAILLEFSGTMTYGFGEAIGTLVPQAGGTGNLMLAGRYLQLSLILYSVMTIPAIIIWVIWTEDAVLWFGFDKETAKISQEYAYPFLVLMFLGGFDHGIHEFLSAMGHEKYSTMFQILYYAVECLGVIIAVSSGVKDLMMIGIVQASLGVVMSVLNVGCVLYFGWMDVYWEGLVETLSLRDGRAIHTMVITAIPLSISWLLTYGEWEVLTIFASVMGPAEVAAWGMLGFVWDTFERITAGFADAAEVRIGFRMGAGQPHHAKLAAYKAMYMAVVVSLFSTGVLFILAGHLPRWLTPDPTLQKMIFDVLPLMGFGQILLIIGTVSWGIVGAQGRVRLATAIEFCTSWIVCIPLCSISLYVLNYDLNGFVAALVFGYTVAGITLGFIIVRSDWQALSQTIISRNAIEGVSWQDNDWEELPMPVQTAALVLGYTKQLWNMNEEPPASSKDWKELTSMEKEAARILGYNRRAWDDDSSSNSGADDTEETGKIYDEEDWADLPLDIQEAAKVLGYDSTIWDCGGSSHTDSKCWVQLTEAEQVAARRLGYTEKIWDEDRNADMSSQPQSS